MILALAITACGDGQERSPEKAGTTTRTVSGLAAQVTELETNIAGYCEVRSSRRVSRAETTKARQDVDALIRLARTHPDLARNALAETSITLRADCENSPLQRPVKRALAGPR